MTPYEEKVLAIFKDLCKKNGGASPHEVTQEMAAQGHLSEMDNVLDIAEIMKNLRDQRRL